jgi:hypothetical protein
MTDFSGSAASTISRNKNRKRWIRIVFKIHEHALKPNLGQALMGVQTVKCSFFFLPK